jgi:hypothetical protein
VEFLEEHPEEVDKMGFRALAGERIGSIVISRFLGKGWSEARVGYSLERNRLIDENIINKKAIDQLLLTLIKAHLLRFFNFIGKGLETFRGLRSVYISYHY